MIKGLTAGANIGLTPSGTDVAIDASAALPRDGSSPMTGNVEMDENYITRAGALYFTGGLPTPPFPPAGGLVLVSSVGGLFSYNDGGTLRQYATTADFAALYAPK